MRLHLKDREAHLSPWGGGGDFSGLHLRSHSLWKHRLVKQRAEQTAEGGWSWSHSRKGGSQSNLRGVYRAVSLTAAGEQLCCWKVGKCVFSNCAESEVRFGSWWSSSLAFSLQYCCILLKVVRTLWTDACSASPDGGMPWSPTSILSVWLCWCLCNRLPSARDQWDFLHSFVGSIISFT